MGLFDNIFNNSQLQSTKLINGLKLERNRARTAAQKKRLQSVIDDLQEKHFKKYGVWLGRGKKTS